MNILILCPPHFLKVYSLYFHQMFSFKLKTCNYLITAFFVELTHTYSTFVILFLFQECYFRVAMTRGDDQKVPEQPVKRARMVLIHIQKDEV